MKILFIQPTGDKRGHYGLWTSKLCQAISKQGHSLCLFTNKIYPERFLDEAPQFEIIEFGQGKYRFDAYDLAMEKKSPMYWWGYFKTTYIMVKNALELCKSQSFDAIFLTDVEYMIAAILLKRYKRYLPPVIWHVQAANFTFSTYCGSWLKKTYKTLQRSIFKRTLGHEVKGFAVLGEFHKQQLQEQLRLADSFPIEVIPDGADVQTVPFSQMEARKKIGLDYAGPVILFLGMLRKDKGIEYLIEAMSYLEKETCHIVIAGAPFEWTEKELIALISEQVKDKITLHLHYIPDEQIPAYYTACDVVIFPYSNEYTGGCGPLIKGASAYAKPVIVTNVSDIGRVVREHRNGLVLEPCQARPLADAMLCFLRMPTSERQLLIQNAEALAQKHAWNNISAQLTVFLDRVVTSPFR